MTNSEFIEFFLNIKRLSIADTTADSYRHILYRLLDGDLDVGAIDLLAAQQTVFKMACRLSQRTVQRYLVILNEYYDYAAKYNLLQHNFYHDVEIPRKKISVDGMKNKIYSELELKYIFNYLQAKPLVWQAYIVLALDSGARRGELVGLSWSDVDFEKGFLLIRRAAYKLSGQPTAYKEPKGHKSRGMFLSNYSLRLLRKLKVEQKAKCMRQGTPWSKNNFIFSFGTGKTGMHPNTPTRFMRRFFCNIRLPELSGKNGHAFRHTCATLLLREGIDVRTVSERLGHSSINTTMIYLHPDETEETARAMENIIKKAVIFS